MISDACHAGSTSSPAQQTPSCLQVVPTLMGHASMGASVYCCCATRCRCSVSQPCSPFSILLAQLLSFPFLVSSCSWLFMCGGVQGIHWLPCCLLPWYQVAAPLWYVVAAMHVRVCCGMPCTANVAAMAARQVAFEVPVGSIGSWDRP